MSDTADELPRLSAAQAAARLGVKPETLYAYVSRGRLGRRRTATGSTFDPLEVEAFAAGRRTAAGATTAAGAPSGTPLMTIETDLALIADDELYLRGVPAAELAVGGDFEQVCRWVWTGERAGPAFRTAPEVRDRLADLLPLTGLEVSALDRIHLQVIAAAGADPVRHDPSPATVVRQAGGLLSAMVEALPVRGSAGSNPTPADASLARRLWPRLSARRPLRSRVAVLDAALILLLDHDLAASTMAVRVAASARANLYAAVSAGLGALDSALHGNVSRASFALLGQLLDGRPPAAALGEAVAASGGVPGFGHRIYRRRDPRADCIVELLAELAEAGPVLAAYHRLVEEVAHRTGSFPNVDLALAAMSHALGMEAGSGSAVFALGRTAGWVSHVLQEFAEPPLRLRPVGRYVDRPTRASGPVGTDIDSGNHDA